VYIDMFRCSCPPWNPFSEPEVLCWGGTCLHALPPSVTRIKECFQELSRILFKFLQSITSGLDCTQSSNNCFFMWSFSDHYEKAHWLDPVCVGCLELDSSSIAC
jgi:hypothetical protein